MGALHIAAVGDGDDHVLAGDQVLVFHVRLALDELGAAGDGEVFAHFHKFFADDGHHPLARAEDFQVAGDQLGQFLRLGENLVAAEAGETGEGQGPG